MRKKASNFISKQKIPVLVWMMVILVLSGYPGQKLPEIPVWQFDKLVHSLIYAILSICFLLSYYQQYKIVETRLKVTLIVILITVFYGGLMEIFQNYIFINRSGNWYDFIANTIGAIAGVLIYPYIIKLLPINRWLKIK